MKVYQIRIKINLIKEISAEEISLEVTKLLDSVLIKDSKYLEFHNENKYKNYCFDLPYPIERDKVYKKDYIYTLTVRTTDIELVRFFDKNIIGSSTPFVKCIDTHVRIIPEKIIDTIYTLTPALLKDDKGYWKGNITLEEYEKRLKENLIKKWNSINRTKIDEDFELYTRIEFINNKPISVKYKNITLLGDKICLHIATNETAQKLAHMCLGTGLLEANSRGFGYVNYRWV